jgi:hypothetical protein
MHTCAKLCVKRLLWLAPLASMCMRRGGVHMRPLPSPPLPPPLPPPLSPSLSQCSRNQRISGARRCNCRTVTKPSSSLLPASEVWVSAVCPHMFSSASLSSVFLPSRPSSVALISLCCAPLSPMLLPHASLLCSLSFALLSLLCSCRMPPSDAPASCLSPLLLPHGSLALRMRYRSCQLIACF